MNLFVYGSLMFPEVVKAVIGKQLLMKDAVLKGYKRYKVENGEYPAIVKDEDSSVTGKLIEIDKNGLKVLDSFEGEEYKRETVLVEVDGKKQKAEAYIWKSNQKLSKTWSLEEFKEKHIKKFIESIPRRLRK